MLLTFGAMLSALYSDLKYGAAPDLDVTTRLKRLLNEAHRTILRAPKMAEERAIELTFDSIASQVYYGIPQAFDAIRDIRQIDQSIPLRMRTREWVVYEDPQENTIGTPYVWIPNGMQPVSRQPAIAGSGVWAVSTDAADTTQTVRLMCARARAGLTTEQTVMLAGTTPVRVGVLEDIAGILQFTLSAPCAGDVSLFDAATPSGAVPIVLPPGALFPAGATWSDSFSGAAQDPIAGPWEAATQHAPAGLARNGAGALVVAPLQSRGASWLREVRLGADFDAWLQIDAAPIPVAAFASLWLTVDRPVTATGLGRRGFRISLTAGNVTLDQWDGSVAHNLIDVSAAPMAVGDGIGVSRRGSVWTLYRFNPASSTWKVLGAPATVGAYLAPLYPAVEINDATHVLGFSQFSAGPFDSRFLGRIDRFAGTAQPYYSIRLWPTPQGPLTYTVRGTVRIADMVQENDYPIFVQPEFCDALMTYARMREYKTVKADTDRFVMERDEWSRVIESLNAVANFPHDYRPVAGAGDRGRWSNLGGFYPADVGGWNW